VNERPPVPCVGVGCIVVHAGRVLLVRQHGGRWSTPGGHLDFGESPEDAAVRETMEETGVRVYDVEFVAITNDVMPDLDRHYVTIWMRGETADPTIRVGDSREIQHAAWFDPTALPEPRHAFFENLLSRRTHPRIPPNLLLPSPRVRGDGSDGVS
jgi:8-oxo-dGTP diphosphatase